MLIEQKILLKERERKEHKLIRRRTPKMSRNNKHSLVNEYLKSIINYVSAKKYSISSKKRSQTSYNFNIQSNKE